MTVTAEQWPTLQSSVEFPVWYSRHLLAIYSVHSGVHISIPISQVIPPPSNSRFAVYIYESTSPLQISYSTCQLYHMIFHSLSVLLHSAWQSLYTNLKTGMGISLLLPRLLFKNKDPFDTSLPQFIRWQMGLWWGVLTCALHIPMIVYINLLNFVGFITFFSKKAS